MNNDRLKYLMLDEESLEDLSLTVMVKIADKEVRDRAVTLCEMILSKNADITMQNLFGFDLEARDVLHKLTIAKVWHTLDEVED